MLYQHAYDIDKSYTVVNISDYPNSPGAPKTGIGTFAPKGDLFMKFLLAVPFLALLFAPLAEAGSVYPVLTTQVQCDGPYPMTTLLKMINLAAEEAQKDLQSQCQGSDRLLSRRQKLEHFSVEGETVTCVKITVTQSCYVI